MSTNNPIYCLRLSVLLHLLGLLLICQWVSPSDEENEIPPEQRVDLVELTLSTTENEGAAGTAAKPGAAAAQSGQPEPAPSFEPPTPIEPAPPIELPKPVEPVPQPNLPDKPSFLDALKPPPEPEPEPEPAPDTMDIPLPAASPTVAPAPAPTPSATQYAAAPTPGRPTEQAQLLPAGEGGDSGGGGGGGINGRLDVHPSLDRAIKPNYPIGARRKGEEGTVILDVSVTADGHASAVSLVSSSGFPELDKAAEHAAEQARFKPGARGGRPVDSAARLTIIFRLRDQ